MVEMLDKITSYCMLSRRDSLNQAQWNMSINKQAMLAMMTALRSTNGEQHVEMVFSFHPSLPFRHSLIPPSHLGRAKIAWLLHSYKLTPKKTCPQWLLAPHRVWLKLFCLGTAGVHKVTAHSKKAHNGMKTVDCVEPMEKCALIALMAANIDTSCNLSFVSGLEGLLTRPQLHAVLMLVARQRALKWNFNELQYALPPSVIFLLRLKEVDACGWCHWNYQQQKGLICSRQYVTSV